MSRKLNPLDKKYKDLIPEQYKNGKKNVCEFIRNASSHSKENKIEDNEEIPEEIFHGFTSLEAIEKLIFDTVLEGDHDLFVIRLYVVKSNLNTLSKRIKGFIANFYSEVGTAHLAVQISDKMVHWYDSGMVLVKGYEGSNATAVFYPQNKEEEMVPVLDNTPEIRKKICEVIQKYNCDKKYDPKNCNCQHFSQDIFKVLNLNFEFTSMIGPVGSYLNYIIGKGRNEKEHCYLVQNNKIMKDPTTNLPLTWDSHESLDKWSNNEENLNKYSVYIPLIKAFHRGFQMREKTLISQGKETYKGDKDTCSFGWPTLLMKSRYEKVEDLDESYNFFDIETSTSFKVLSSQYSNISSNGISSSRDD